MSVERSNCKIQSGLIENRKDLSRVNFSEVRNFPLNGLHLSRSIGPLL